MSDRKLFQELASLFFATRQIIRQKLPGARPDPNAWLRFETLRYVARAEGPSMQDIADYVRTTAPSATSLVARLVSAGLLVRRGNTSDKRVVRLYVSAKGKAALFAYGKRSEATMRKVFSRLEPHEARELARILRRLQEVHHAASPKER